MKNNCEPSTAFCTGTMDMYRNHRNVWGADKITILVGWIVAFIAMFLPWATATGTDGIAYVYNGWDIAPIILFLLLLPVLNVRIPVIESFLIKPSSSFINGIIEIYCGVCLVFTIVWAYFIIQDDTSIISKILFLPLCLLFWILNIAHILYRDRNGFSGIEKFLYLSMVLLIIVSYITISNYEAEMFPVYAVILLVFLLTIAAKAGIISSLNIILIYSIIYFILSLSLTLSIIASNKFNIGIGNILFSLSAGAIATGVVIFRRIQGDDDGVISDFSEAIRLNPNDAEAYNNRGYAYVEKRDYDKAIADYESALRIDPDNSDAQEALENLKRAEQEQ